MPWKGKQAAAIYLSKKREVGEAAARRFMHAHGNVSKKKPRRKRREGS